MFDKLFSCFNCNSDKTGQVYEIQIQKQGKIEEINYVKSMDDIPLSARTDSNHRVLKVDRSVYDELIEKYKQNNRPMKDMEFPPVQSSVGAIKAGKCVGWKRIPQLIENPVLFDRLIEPSDVIQGSLGDCYFLSAIAALAEEPDHISKIFKRQTYNPNGIYQVRLRIDGIVQDIIVDDYIPVGKDGKAIFCQPNGNEFWVLILEKAWAKAHGSYENIQAGNPAQVFKAVTYAPTQSIYMEEDQQFRQKLWNKILYHLQRLHPCCCGTDDRGGVDWQQLGLDSGHAYTLIKAIELEDKRGYKHRMLKIRNPWGKKQWIGQGCQTDNKFWQRIVQTRNKRLFLADLKIGNDGIFFIKFQDFCQYFYQLHFCLVEENANYVYQPLFNGKNASYFTVYIYTKGQYVFELHQQDIRGESKFRIAQGFPRGTLILGKVDGRQYQFIDGLLKYNSQDLSLKVTLEPGTYILYAKFDPTNRTRSLPKSSSISVYSLEYATLKPANILQNKYFLAKMFLKQASLDKKQTYNDKKMWVSWKTYIQKGGFAYIAFGNDQFSQKKFQITFNERDFRQYNFKLKNPYKRKGPQKIQILPGEEKIILARVENTQIKKVIFPPDIQIKIHTI